MSSGPDSLDSLDSPSSSDGPPDSPSNPPVRTRTITWSDPAPTAEAGRHLSGLEFMRAIVAGELPPPPIAVTLGFALKEVEEGRVVFVGYPAEYQYNPIGTVHGGLAATLLDSAMSCAVQSTLPVGVGYTTLEIKVNFVRPITAGTGELRCEGTTVHVGNRTSTAAGRLIDQSGKLYAHG